VQPRLVGLCRWILALSSLTNITMAFAQGSPQRLQPDEYSAVALIYNHELSALGNRALFPICIGVPSDTPPKALFEYLLRGGFEVSQASVCEPAMALGGQHRPKDYPHGLRIFVDKPQHDSQGLVSMRVVSDDLTLRPGEHLGVMLRRGTYHFKKNEAGEWQIADYTKEYDSKDEKAQVGCDCSKASPATKRPRMPPRQL
jgi:hypothetical protein